MASPVLPNTSNLLGVALVVNRSRDGPRFVFHYPPQIRFGDKKKRRQEQPTSTTARGSPVDELDDDDDDDDDEILVNQFGQPPFGPMSGSLPHAAELLSWNYDDHLETESGTQIVPWEYVAGYPTKDLESLLTPSRAFHKRLFHVSMDQLCFVSSPIYVPENGIWRKKKRQPKTQPPKSPENGPESVPAKDGQSASTVAPPFDAQSPPAEDDRETVVVDESAGSNGGNGSPADEADEKKSGMTMFNLVFILNPKKHEARELAETIYVHILRKVNKLFRYSQQKSDFVWKESKRILELKDKNREAKTKMSLLWKDIIDASSLAACMQDIYEAVSHNKIAALQLDTPGGTIAHSVQIPVPFYLTDLPPEEEASKTRGLWLTTANYFVEDDSLHDPSFLDKHFGLLLMSDEKKVIAELQADADEATAAMVEFVRLSKPTMSFHQISQGSGLSPAQVRKYAEHFIFWRRGIAIPPLHARDVYILSPNADMSLLPRASQAWARAFPLAPHLADFLAELSTAPRPYKWFCPSKNHRPTYLQMLAWLMRGGWVTQLCTFAYVVVWPEILYEVEYELEAEELRHLQEDAHKSKREETVEGGDSKGKGDEKEDIAQHRQYQDHHNEQQQRGYHEYTDRENRFSSAPGSSVGGASTSTPNSRVHNNNNNNNNNNTLPLSLSSSTLDQLAASTTSSAFDGPGGTLSPSLAQSSSHSQSSPGAGGGGEEDAFSPSRNSNNHHNNNSDNNNNNNNTNTNNSDKSPPSSEPASASVSPPTNNTTTTEGERFALAARLSRIADKQAQAAYERHAAFGRKQPPLATAHPSTNQAPHLAHLAPYIIVDARRATGKDSAYLSAIGRRFADPRVRAAWPVFWKYFNGRSALERVVLGLGPDGEGLGGGGGGGIGVQAEGREKERDGKMRVKKRKEAWALMTAMSEHLVCVRHF
ncbi:hypothetical protein F5Y17DRAFT_399580 [Xylariaceae sp. FL0594]|nr:hypothetical protein F5Y17DRAFT_399580 [Xylariaceae sp. FL0594]